MEPPVELDELMQRIQQAVNASRPAGGLSDGTQASPASEISSPPRPVASAPDEANRIAMETTLAEIVSMVARARQKTDVQGVPKILRSLYRNQGGFNGILLAAVQRLVEASKHLELQNAKLQARIDTLERTEAQQHDWIASIVASHERQREWMATMELCLLETDSSPAAWEQRFRALRQKQSSRHNGAPMGDEDHATLAHLETRVDAVDSHANRLGNHLNNLQAQVDDHSERYANWLAHYRQATAHHDALDQAARRLEERQHNDASYFKNQLWFLQRLVQPLLEGKTPTTAANGSDETKPGEHEFDALYLAFEEAMRGNRNEVKERTRVYLPYVSAANAGTTERPVLDLGCGRGEWLEVLREQGLGASGIDLNTCMIEVCRERGLNVTMANALDHLGSLANESCGAVTAFHLIEHLPFPVLIRFFHECRRVLKPGGVAIFETPNPYNVLVGSGYFYHDFTHQRPLPPTSTKFLAEQTGFSKVEILPLHPWDEAAKVHGEGDKALEWRFNELFYGPQDYALIATP